MTERQFGFAIIGAGTISDIHARAIQAIPNARLIGVYTPNKEKSLVFAAKYNCESYDSLAAMLLVADIDVVCICTPSGVHLDPVLESVKAGKHCVIEKPLEVTLERCDRIIEAANTSGVKTAVIFPSRFYAASQQIKLALEEHRFGNLAFGDAYVKWSRSEAYYQSAAWRGTWKLDGGGALMNQGIHSVDLLQWYMGDVVSVQAVMTNIKHTSIEVEDTVVATLEFANGALGVIQCSTAVFPGSLKRIEIMGSSGTAILEESNLIKWHFQQPQPEDDAIVGEMSSGKVSHGGVSNPADISFYGHQKQLEDMIHAIQNDSKPVIDAVEGRKSVAIVLAIYESAKTGKKVQLSIR
ncbi:MAG: Gfo/Idh/MocA family oxidoreductase [Sphingobacteriales bacterium]|nr:MAG: Gfo/Idh/MocA family oxidoreductase [Sphingobacteriales bacterium]